MKKNKNDLLDSAAKAIGNNKTERALDLLQFFFERDDLPQAITIQKARFIELRQQMQRGIIDSQTADLKGNKIRNSLLTIIKKIKNGDDDLNSIEIENSNLKKTVTITGEIAAGRDIVIENYKSDKKPFWKFW